MSGISFFRGDHLNIHELYGNKDNDEEWHVINCDPGEGIMTIGTIDGKRKEITLRVPPDIPEEWTRPEVGDKVMIFRGPHKSSKGNCVVEEIDVYEAMVRVSGGKLVCVPPDILRVMEKGTAGEWDRNNKRKSDNGKERLQHENYATSFGFCVHRVGEDCHDYKVGDRVCEKCKGECWKAVPNCCISNNKQGIVQKVSNCYVWVKWDNVGNVTRKRKETMGKLN